ncbi:polyadenylate-binding protein 3 isoform X1 [Thalassophryne amazonica]|uniref:polyadenylate-binding protein 3 isoform X1 n=1 Tax=Thalassophryne amazonica TaxID=390379 RepID=UPI0014710990|nr:polyadenylate-binding protein 3 isoform X1 [Thalassophryne amazonica]
MDEDDLETLGEKLYDQIYLRHKETAGKLTGMLLELPCHVLSKMLQDEVMLEGALEKALRALQLAQESSKVVSKDKDDVSVSSDSLGEQLFELVEVYNTGHSQKITGMLLEQDKEAILNLLSDPKLLEEQMNQALKMLQGQNLETHDSDSDTDETERLGEKIFSLVEKLDPLHAHDITGMLLEMDRAGLQQMLTDNTMLKVAVQKAQATLET